MGYEDLNDAGELRYDPVLSLVSGRARRVVGKAEVLAKGANLLGSEGH